MTILLSKGREKGGRGKAVFICDMETSSINEGNESGSNSRFDNLPTGKKEFNIDFSTKRPMNGPVVDFMDIFSKWNNGRKNLDNSNG